MSKSQKKETVRKWFKHITASEATKEGRPALISVKKKKTGMQMCGVTEVKYVEFQVIEM